MPSVAGGLNHWPKVGRLKTLAFITCMLKNEWVDNETTINIDPSGEIKNGHHRILATYRSKITQRFRFENSFDFVALNEKLIAANPELAETILHEISDYKWPVWK